MKRISSFNKPAKPKSSTDFFINMVTCVLFFILALGFYDYRDGYWILYVIVVVSIIPIILSDFFAEKSNPKPYSLSFESLRESDLKRVSIKLVGLYGTFFFVFFVYWLLPVYKDPFYIPYFNNLEYLLPWLIVLAIPYFSYVDRRMKDPKDGYWHMGNMLLFDFDNIDKKYIIEHIKSWIVKIFFLPLMGIYMVNNLNFLVAHDLGEISSFKGLYNYFYNFIFTVDLLFATFGYVFTLKIFNSQIYSTEPTVLGWVCCIVGYAPFWQALFSPQYFAYEDNITWENLFTNSGFIYVIWGGVILICLTMYSFATIAFGYRFSNLSFRGVVTNGPYALTKHPAYVFKNISWWLISVPFISDAGWLEALRNCILLFGVNIVYYMRARTEENHLSNYPEYVAYAEYMNEHSIFSWVGDIWPALKYNKERALNPKNAVYKPFTQRL